MFKDLQEREAGSTGAAVAAAALLTSSHGCPRLSLFLLLLCCACAPCCRPSCRPGCLGRLPLRRQRLAHALVPRPPVGVRAGGAAVPHRTAAAAGEGLGHGGRLDCMESSSTTKRQHEQEER